MKKKILTTLGLLLGVVILYIVWVVITSVLRTFVDSLKTLNQNQTTLLIAVIPSTISILGVVMSNNFQRGKELDFKNREKKEKAYDGLIDVFYQFIARSAKGKPTDDLTPLIISSRKDLVLWGSDEVVKLFSEFMTISQETPDSNSDKGVLMNSKLEQMIMAIRKDLGYKNNKLGIGDLSRFFR